jgi:hypothetical protein
MDFTSPLFSLKNQEPNEINLKMFYTAVGSLNLHGSSDDLLRIALALKGCW